MATPTAWTRGQAQKEADARRASSQSVEAFAKQRRIAAQRLLYCRLCPDTPTRMPVLDSPNRLRCFVIVNWHRMVRLLDLAFQSFSLLER